MLDYDYSKLRGRIVEKFGSISNFVDHLSISRTALNSKLSNKTDISRKDIIEWSNLLDISPGDYSVYFFVEKSTDCKLEGV